MKRILHEGFFIFLISSLMIFPCFAVLKDSKHWLNAQQEQTLYFQSGNKVFIYPYLSCWEMNPSLPSDQGSSAALVDEDFVSLPLAYEFTFEVINTTIYHEEVPSGRGTWILTLNFSLVEKNGFAHLVSSDQKVLADGSVTNSFSTNLTVRFLQGERLLVRIGIENTQGFHLFVHWGNSTYPSRISYEGSAVYVPEFPTLLFLQLFIIPTLLAVIVYRRMIPK